MKLLVISHKECWRVKEFRSGFGTVGGFPFQMQAVSELFEQTTLQISMRFSLVPEDIEPLTGFQLKVCPLPEPRGRSFLRKLALLYWLPVQLPRIWRRMQKADAVHAPVPGDIGLIGILVALTQRKLLFVRHCGTWGEPVTTADRFLLWLLERIAGGRNVVMATGGGEKRPSVKNPAITWIHSTTLREADIEAIVPATPWRQGNPLRLVTVGRVTPEKNAAAAIQALPKIQQHYPQTFLDVVGAGPALDGLKKLARDLHMEQFVTFHGNVSHERVLSILHASHLFVFPTKVKEGFPKAVLEAMACGLPVVATAVSVLPHLIGAANGIVLPEPTAKAVAEAVLSLIADDVQMAAMSQHARETSRQYTLESWQAIIKERLTAAWGPLKQD